jgi:hypothetical protein
MRKTEFRGREPGGKWAYGDLLTKEIDTPEMRFTGFVGIQTDNGFLYVEKKTVGEYTGLIAEKSYRGESREARKVFEGDILRQNGDLFVVKWTKVSGAFEIYRIGDTLRLSMIHLDGKEIIGNIHDTPQLLGRE